MSSDSAPATGEVSHVESGNPATLTAELRDTQRTAKSLLRLIQHAQGEQDQEMVEALEQFAEARIPRARALARAAFAGVIPAEGIMILWRRAKQAFHASAPAVMDMYLEKMEQGSDCKYSERLLVEAMKGMGMLVPGEPVSEQDRAVSLGTEDLESLPDAELMQKLRVQAGLEGDDE